MKRINKFIKHKRLLWHKHFIPSLIAGIAVAIIALFMNLTLSNVILFASIGASAIILTNSYSHHLTRLHTVIIAYVIAISVAVLVHFINTLYPLHISANSFLLVFLVGISLYLFNAVHPPALSASLAFVLLERQISDLIYLFLSIIILLILVRFMTYLFSQNLSIKEFVKEFKHSFDKDKI